MTWPSARHFKVTVTCERVTVTSLKWRADGQSQSVHTSFVQSINFWCSFHDKIYNHCLSLVQLWCKWGPSNLEQLYCKRIIWLSCKAILSQYITKKIIWIKKAAADAAAFDSVDFFTKYIFYNFLQLPSICKKKS